MSRKWYLSDLHFALQDIEELRQSDTPVEALRRTTELDRTVRRGGGDLKPFVPRILTQLN